MRRKILFLMIMLGLACAAGTSRWASADEKSAPSTSAAPAAQTSQEAKKAETEDNETLAVVNGNRITRQQVAEQLMLVYGRDALNWLIECNLIEQEAKKNGVDATPEEIKARLEKEVDRRFEQIMTRFRIKNVSELAEFIKRNGGNIDSVRKRFTTEVAPGVRPAILEDKLLRMRVTVTPEEVRDRYQKLYGPRLEAQQIVVATKKEADDLVAKIRAGADFAILAREQSLDTASRGSGGKMQTLSSDSELGRAMANLKEGEVSDPVPIGDLYHILKLNKRIGSETVKFSDIEAKLKDEIANENMEKLRSSWRAALKDKADIRILNPLN